MPKPKENSFQEFLKQRFTEEELAEIKRRIELDLEEGESDQASEPVTKTYNSFEEMFEDLMKL